MSRSVRHDESFEKIMRKGRSSNTSDRFETVRKFSGRIGKGFIKEIEIRPGVKLLLMNCETKENTVAEVTETSAFLECCFCVSGSILSQVRGFQDDLVMNSGMCNLSFFPEPNGRVQYCAGPPMVFVVIRIDAWALGGFLDGRFDGIPGDICDIAGGVEKLYYQAGDVTASMKMVIHQILNCPYAGAIKQLYLETKVMELLVHQLAALAAGRNKKDQKPVLRSGDIERVHEARDVLIRNIQEPPSLMELARKVGLNDYKLKIGFRQLFGSTVFGFLHAYRMECARCLFEETRKNVAEVSSCVGYTNPSHFAAAFKKQFGINPGYFLSEVRKRNGFTL